MKFLFALCAIVVCAFAVSPMMTDPISTIGSISMAMALPMGIFLDPGTGGAGGGVDPKETQLLEKIRAEVTKSFSQLVEGSEDFKALKSLQEKLKGASSAEDLKALKTEIEKLGLDLKALSEKNDKKQDGSKSFGDALITAFKSLFNEDGTPKEQIKELKRSKGSHIILDIKAPATMTTANVTPTTPGAIPFSLADFDPMITPVVRRQPFIQELISASRTNKTHVVWVEQANPDPGAAANTAEGAAKTQGDFDVVERSCPVEKMTYYIKASREVLDDLSELQALINNEILTLLRLRLDQQIVYGTGVSPQLKGITAFAIPAFAAGSFATAVPSANIFDVIRVAIAQIMSADPNGPFMPNYVIMNPIDAARLDLAKDSTGAYALPPFIMPGGRTIAGVRVIENIGVTANTMVVGDFTKSNLRLREDAMISIGYENDDFTKNLVTILGEIRAVHYIKTNHLKAFVNVTDIDAAIAAILAP